MWINFDFHDLQSKPYLDKNRCKNQSSVQAVVLPVQAINYCTSYTAFH